MVIPNKIVNEALKLPCGCLGNNKQQKLDNQKITDKSHIPIAQPIELIKKTTQSTAKVETTLDCVVICKNLYLKAILRDISPTGIVGNIVYYTEYAPENQVYLLLNEWRTSNPGNYDLTYLKCCKDGTDAPCEECVVDSDCQDPNASCNNGICTCNNGYYDCNGTCIPNSQPCCSTPVNNQVSCITNCDCIQLQCANGVGVCINGVCYCTCNCSNSDCTLPNGSAGSCTKPPINIFDGCVCTPTCQNGYQWNFETHKCEPTTPCQNVTCPTGYVAVPTSNGSCACYPICDCNDPTACLGNPLSCKPHPTLQNVCYCDLCAGDPPICENGTAVCVPGQGWLCPCNCSQAQCTLPNGSPGACQSGIITTDPSLCFCTVPCPDGEIINGICYPLCIIGGKVPTPLQLEIDAKTSCTNDVVSVLLDFSILNLNSLTNLSFEVGQTFVINNTSGQIITGYTAANSDYIVNSNGLVTILNPTNLVQITATFKNTNCSLVKTISFDASNFTGLNTTDYTLTYDNVVTNYCPNLWVLKQLGFTDTKVLFDKILFSKIYDVDVTVLNITLNLDNITTNTNITNNYDITANGDVFDNGATFADGLYKGNYTTTVQYNGIVYTLNNVFTYFISGGFVRFEQKEAIYPLLIDSLTGVITSGTEMYYNVSPNYPDTWQYSVVKGAGITADNVSNTLPIAITSNGNIGIFISNVRMSHKTYSENEIGSIDFLYQIYQTDCNGNPIAKTISESKKGIMAKTIISNKALTDCKTGSCNDPNKICKPNPLTGNCVCVPNCEAQGLCYDFETQTCIPCQSDLCCEIDLTTKITADCANNNFLITYSLLNTNPAAENCSDNSLTFNPINATINSSTLTNPPSLNQGLLDVKADCLGGPASIEFTASGGLSCNEEIFNVDLCDVCAKCAQKNVQIISGQAVTIANEIAIPFTSSYTPTGTPINNVWNIDNGAFGTAYFIDGLGNNLGTTITTTGAAMSQPVYVANFDATSDLSVTVDFGNFACTAHYNYNTTIPANLNCCQPFTYVGTNQKVCWEIDFTTEIADAYGDFHLAYDLHTFVIQDQISYEYSDDNGATWNVLTQSPFVGTVNVQPSSAAGYAHNDYDNIANLTVNQPVPPYFTIQNGTVTGKVRWYATVLGTDVQAGRRVKICVNPNPDNPGTVWILSKVCIDPNACKDCNGNDVPNCCRCIIANRLVPPKSCPPDDQIVCNYLKPNTNLGAMTYGTSYNVWMPISFVGTNDNSCAFVEIAEVSVYDDNGNFLHNGTLSGFSQPVLLPGTYEFLDYNNNMPTGSFFNVLYMSGTVTEPSGSYYMYVKMRFTETNGSFCYGFASFHYSVL